MRKRELCLLVILEKILIGSNVLSQQGAPVSNICLNHRQNCRKQQKGLFPITSQKLHRVLQVG
jgi:hypothetical protein